MRNDHLAVATSPLATDDAPITQRLGAFELAFALAAMDEERPISEDDPTIELPPPPLPPGLPSPLGDDDAPPPSETLTIQSLDLDLDHVFPAPAGPSDTTNADLLARRTIIASWTVAVAMVGACTYMLSTV